MKQLEVGIVGTGKIAASGHALASQGIRASAAVGL